VASRGSSIKDEAMLERVIYDNDFNLHEADDPESNFSWKTL
jgi:hypothetical protein